VLWALGSMLGATQSIDMITSSRKSYGRVEVAVLNVDLLPNMINTMVIGDKANDSAKPSESRDSERKSNASKGQSSGSGQKTDPSSDARHGNGPPIQNAGTVPGQIIIGVQHASVKSGQQGTQYPDMLNEAHTCSQHVMAPGSIQGNEVDEQAYHLGGLVQIGNAEQVANLLSSMHDNFNNGVNSLCNDSLLLSDWAIGPVDNPQLESKSLVTSIHGAVMHGNEVHGAASGTKNSTLKSKADNSSMNFNQQLLNMD
jgi:hypothetical protein